MDYQSSGLTYMRLFPKKSWDNIEEVAPDEWDLQMLHDAETSPDCKEFVSAETAMKELGLN